MRTSFFYWILTLFFIACSGKNSDLDTQVTTKNEKEIKLNTKEIFLSNSSENSQTISENSKEKSELNRKNGDLYIKFSNNIKNFYRLINKIDVDNLVNDDLMTNNNIEKKTQSSNKTLQLAENMKKMVYPLFFYIEFSKISSLPDNYQSFFDEEKRYFSIPSVILDSRHVLAHYSLLKDASVWFIKDEESDVYLRIKGVDEEFNIVLFEAERDLKGINYISFENISKNYLAGELFYSINHAHQLEHSFFKFFIEAYYYSPFYEAVSSFFSRSISDFSHAGSIIFDKDGNFGGIVTLFDAYYKNSGMVVSALIVKKIVEKLQKGYFIKNEAWIGFTVEQKKDYIQIKTVLESSPASKANLNDGDRVLSINKKYIKTKKDLFNIVQFIQPGNRLEFEIIRNDKKILKYVTAEVKPATQLKNSIPDESILKGRILGISLFDEEGKICISNVEDGSVAFFYEFKKGDCIVKINDFTINSKEDFTHFFENRVNKGDSIQFMILRNSKKHFIGMKKP